MESAGDMQKESYGPEVMEAKVDAEKLLSKLDPQSREIIERLWGINGGAQNYSEIAEDMKLDRGTVTRIAERALKSLKTYVGEGAEKIEKELLSAEFEEMKNRDSNRGF